jgi:hypothetical protein
MLFVGGLGVGAIAGTGTLSYIGSYQYIYSGGGSNGSDWRMPSSGSGSIIGTWTYVSQSSGTGVNFGFLLRTS